MSEQFAGFELPKENWSKLPHSLIDHLYLMTSEAEVKVVLYILRHTWGFGDDQKKITIDEFCNGRKRKDGNRLDNGTGLSVNSVKDGIARAIEHGFIEVLEDATDAARIKRFYQLRGSEVDPPTLNSGGQKLTPWGSEVDPHLSEVDPRTEKETYGKKLTEINIESSVKTDDKSPEQFSGNSIDDFFPRDNKANGSTPQPRQPLTQWTALMGGRIGLAQRDEKVDLAEKDLDRAAWNIRQTNIRQACIFFVAYSPFDVPTSESVRSLWLKTLKTHLDEFGIKALPDLYQKATAILFDKDRMKEKDYRAPSGPQGYTNTMEGLRAIANAKPVETSANFANTPTIDDLINNPGLDLFTV